MRVLIINKVDLVIGCDAGLSHAATVIGTPMVSYCRASMPVDAVPVDTQRPSRRCFRNRCDGALIPNRHSLGGGA